jgi:hypothetical protein
VFLLDAESQDVSGIGFGEEDPLIAGRTDHRGQRLLQWSRGMIMN